MESAQSPGPHKRDSATSNQFRGLSWCQHSNQKRFSWTNPSRSQALWFQQKSIREGDQNLQ